MINVITKLYLEDEELSSALSTVITAAPRGVNSLVGLHSTTIEKLITHPGKVAVIQPAKFLIDLKNVDTAGYSVYDKTFTKLYTVYQDVQNPDDDLSVPHLRPMTFGYHTYDLAWVMTLKHGDIFYISYDSDALVPSIHLVLMLYPAVTGGI
jgi:hypothetical protein